MTSAPNGCRGPAAAAEAHRDATRAVADTHAGKRTVEHGLRPRPAQGCLVTRACAENYTFVLLRGVMPAFFVARLVPLPFKPS